MAYRRKQQMARASTFPDVEPPPSPPPEGSSLAAQAIRASSAHRDSSLSTAYGESAYREPDHLRRPGASFSRPDSSPTYEYTSMKSLDESKYGFWGVLARKAKSILEDENAAKEFEASKRSPRPQMIDPPTGDPLRRSYQSQEGNRKLESPKLQRGLGAITSSLNQIGEKIGNALEEGLTIVENRTGDIISETKKLNIRRRGATNSATSVIHQPTVIDFVGQRQPVSQTVQADQETQLKASRDVAMAMAAKAKVLLRELKTVKADLAFAKQRCAQLEEENKILRESRDKGDNPEDDDLIRLQLETLLAEKARLAHENSIYARENRFLREIVEYHQLTMQDVVYVDEGHEEVTEVYPIGIPSIDVDVRPVVPTPPPGVEMLSPACSSTGPTSPGPSNLVDTLPSSSPSPTTRDMISPTGNIQPASGLKATKGDMKQQNSSTYI